MAKSIMEELGPAYWAQLHGTCPNGAMYCKATELVGGFCDTLVCPHCAMGCKKMMSADHDLKNMQLGKRVMDMDNFNEVKAAFNDPHNTCIGICPNQCRGGACKAH